MIEDDKVERELKREHELKVAAQEQNSMFNITLIICVALIIIMFFISSCEVLTINNIRK